MANYYDRTGEPMTMHVWAQRFEDLEYKRVASDTVGDFDVSTVWLGIDHRFAGDGAPLIFETIVFGGNELEDNEQRRYATEDEARAGHAEIVERLKGEVA